jgi:hypothetical protein
VRRECGLCQPMDLICALRAARDDHYSLIVHGRSKGVEPSASRENFDREILMDIGTAMILAFILVVGPLAYLFGADSRVFAERGWLSARRS